MRTRTKRRNHGSDMEQASILVVDDERSICQLCKVELERVGMQVDWTTNPLEALSRLENEPRDLLITDFKMPEMDGIAFMREAQKIRPGIPVIIMTAYTSLDIALKALKQGASNFLNKPFHRDELIFAVQSVIEKQRLLQENLRLKSLVNLIKVSDQIITVHEPKKIYTLLMDAVMRETGATRGKIYQFNEKTHQLILECESLQNGRTSIRFSVDSDKAAKPDEATVREAAQDGGQLTTPQVAIPLQTTTKFLGLLSLSKDENQPFSQIDLEIARVLASQAAVALENSSLLHELENLFLETIKSLASTLDEKDPYTHGHSQRVSSIAVEIGQRLGLDHEQLDILALAGSLHDIGKIGIPDRILFKAGRLTDEEFEIIKTHPEKGARILSHIERLKPVVDAVYTHHEWYNGKGYPRGLKGDKIPISGAIISIADALDTITTDRPYSKRRTPEEAYQILRENAGTQFHPDIVEAVLKAPLKTLEQQSQKVALQEW